METTKEKTGTIPDFTSLPDVVWIKVLKLLTVEERYVLSQTCKRLHTLFSSPSVWKSIFLTVTVPRGHNVWSYRTQDVGHLPPCQRSALGRFGAFIEHVTLQMSKFKIDSVSYSALLSLPNRNGLQSFTLHLYGGILEPNLFHDLDQYKYTNIGNVISGVRNQWTECVIHIDYNVCGMIVDLHSNILQCSPSDLRCKHLRTLKIHHMEMKSEQYSRSICIRDMVTRFPALQHLHLGDFAFSDQLLERLAQQQGLLRTLTITVTRVVNDVSSTAWSRLVAACPLLQVFCSFRKFHNVERVIKPEAPLVGIVVQSVREGPIDIDLFESFCFDHQNTLQKLEYQMLRGSSSGFTNDPGELPIVSIVTGCPKLVELNFGGVIEQNDIIRLAELDRRWKTLKIYYDFVRSRNEQSECDVDFEELEAVMSQHLGYPWKFSKSFS